MKHQISHRTTYSYDQPVSLGTHLVRLKPRCNGWQSCEDWKITVTPQPLGLGELVDLDGNAVVQMWFDLTQMHSSLEIVTSCSVRTFQSNPFAFLMEPWAITMPYDYPVSLHSQLLPYLRPGTAIDPIAHSFAQTLWDAAQGNTLAFLTKLNLEIGTQCEYVIRESGEPWPAGLTWTKRLGSCRDYAVLFMEVCRSQNLAARFVSGYYLGLEEAGKVMHPDRELHGWVEVYLPGAGWRGYDPSHGSVVSDRHIALCASAFPSEAGPIVGRVTSSGVAVGSRMSYELAIVPA